MELKRLLDQPNKLPTIPKVVQQLIKSFSDDDVSIHEISRQIATDPALSAKLLRLANSAYFHVSRTIGTVDDALRMLGFVMVRNLVLGNGMVAAFRNTPGMNLQQFWLYNLYTACASRWLAAAAEVNADMAFTVGLMHGIGQLQMHAGMPEAMAPLDQQTPVLDSKRAAQEKLALGFHHGDVAAELARLWNFPESIIVALRNTPLPLDGEEFSESAAFVHLGAWRARMEVLSVPGDELAASYPHAVAKRLGLGPHWVPALAGEKPDPAKPPMPPLKDLTAGLEAMLA